jgi:hypothetical protein
MRLESNSGEMKKNDRKTIAKLDEAIAVSYLAIGHPLFLSTHNSGGERCRPASEKVANKKLAIPKYATAQSARI